MADIDPGRGPVCEEQCVSSCADTVDDDGDGWPAVTVHVCGVTEGDKKLPCNALEPNIAGVTIQGRSTLDLQVDPQFFGAAVSSCEVTGTLDTQIKYNVVGADLYLANTPISVTSAIASLPLYKVNSQQSRFRALRIDGKHGSPNWHVDFDQHLATCKQIIARQNELQ